MEAMLEASPTLRDNQPVRAVVTFAEGPTLSLSGTVISSSPQGVLVEWAHPSPRDADTVDRIIQGHVLGRERRGRTKEPKGSPEEGKPDAKAPSGTSTQAPEIVTGEHPEAQVDVAATIRSKARTVKSADLASRLETVQVLDIQAIKALVKEAVDESVALLSATFREEERKRLFEEAEAAFKEKLEVYRAEKQDQEEKARVLQAQLEKTNDLLDEERRRVLEASQFTVSDRGMLLLEQRLGRIMDHALRSGQADKPIEDEMRGIVQRLLDDEREKIREQAQKAQSDKIALLERKVQRLAESLDSANKELGESQRRAQALQSAGAIPLANVVRSDLDKDPAKDRKLNLLKEIFEFNKSMRAELAASGRLPPGRRREMAPAEATCAAPPSTPDEASIAAELGIKKAIPSVEGAASAGISPAAQQDFKENGSSSAGEPAASSGEGGTDDLPWEPQDDRLLESARDAPIRSLEKQGE
jgi:hypothetical protein